MAEKKIGFIEDFFAHISVASIKVESQGIKIGDTLRIHGHTTDITFTVDSMQIDHKNVDEVKVGEEVGIKVPERVRKDDIVYKVK